MAQLKLPRLPADGGASLPPEWGWKNDAARRSAVVLLGRREFLKAAAILFAALATPVTGVRRAMARARGGFFTAQEFATLEALSDRIIPPDHDPGAKALGAAAYIEGLLTAFDDPGRVPRIFAGGPFSNRNVFPDTRKGKPSHKRPKNALKNFIPPTRVQELRWRAELFGSDQVPGADFNDVALGGPLVGLRRIYQDGLKKVDEMATALSGKPYAKLPPDEQDRLLALFDAGAFQPDPRRGGMTFISLVIEHTLEGCLALPEYGGNRGRRGWKMLGLEGDSQPLGYSIFSKAKDGYNERRGHPMSTANPDELRHGTLTPRPISADANAIQDSIVMLSGLFGE